MKTQTKFVTKLLKKTNIKIAYTTENTIEKFLTRKKDNNSNKYKKSGVYQLTCQTCNKRYIGQTAGSFQKRFHGHLSDFKNGNGKSKFAQHLLDNTHSMGPMENVMEILRTMNKETMLNTLENFHIYKGTKMDNKINDKETVRQNILFDGVLHGHLARWHLA